MSKNPFEQAKELFTNREKVEIENSWMVNKILSFNPTTCLLSIQINEVMGKIPNNLVSELLNCVPKSNRVPFLKFARKSKTVEPKLVESIGKKYCCSKYHARQIIDLLRLQDEKPERYFGLKKGE